MKTQTPQPRCPNCGQIYQPIEVHGHTQCSVCKVNIEPCCAGGTCDPLAIEHVVEEID